MEASLGGARELEEGTKQGPETQDRQILDVSLTARMASVDPGCL